MFSWISDLFSKSSKPHGQHRRPMPRSIRPQVDALEERALMSATSFVEPADADVWKKTFSAGTSYEVSGTIGGKYSNQVYGMGGDMDGYGFPVKAGTRVDVELTASSLKFETPIGSTTSTMPLSFRPTFGYENVQTATPNPKHITKWSFLLTQAGEFGVSVYHTSQFTYTFKMTMTGGQTSQSVRPDIAMTAAKIEAPNKVAFDFKSNYSDGTGPIKGSFLVRLYKSKDGTDTGQRVAVSEMTVAASAGKGSFDLSNLGLDDNAKLFVSADANNAIKESSETNNVIAVTRIKPDIRMDKIWIDNGNLYLNYEVTGVIAQDSFRTRLVQSNNNTYSEDDTQLAILRMSGTQLAPGKHSAMVVLGAGKTQVPGAGLPEVDGLYFLAAKADFDEKIGETSGTNNTAVMINSDIRMDKVWVDNGKVYYKYEVTGWVPKQQVNVRLVQSTNATFSSDDEKLDSFTLTSAMLTKGIHTVSRTIGTAAGQVRLPGAGLAAANTDIYLVAKIDPDGVPGIGKLGEENETNNEAFTRPDIKITSVRFRGTTQTIEFNLESRDISKSFNVSVYQSNSATFSLSTAVRRGAPIMVNPSDTTGVIFLKDRLKIQDGNYVFVVADFDEKIYEVNEKNNGLRGAAEVELMNPRFDTLSRVKYDYAAWNLSGKFDVYLYQSDALAYDVAKTSKPVSLMSVDVRANTGTFTLLSPAAWDAGRYLHIAANPKGMSTEGITSNNVARLSLPESKNPERSNNWEIQLVWGVDAPGGQYMRFRLAQVYNDGTTGPTRDLVFTGISWSKGFPWLPVSYSANSDPVRFRTPTMMTIEEFEGAGTVTSYPSISPMVVSVMDSTMTLMFGTTPITLSFNSAGLGATLFGFAEGVWTVSKPR